jgi:hypothetical protein
MIPLPKILQLSLGGGGGEGTTTSDLETIVTVVYRVGSHSFKFGEQMSVRGTTNVKCNQFEPQLALWRTQAFSSAGVHTFVVGLWRAWGVVYTREEWVTALALGRLPFFPCTIDRFRIILYLSLQSQWRRRWRTSMTLPVGGLPVAHWLNFLLHVSESFVGARAASTGCSAFS